MDEENGFHCQCPEGFKPPYCYSQVDECGSSPCVHGSCRDDINGYVTAHIAIQHQGETWPICTLAINPTGFYLIVLHYLFCGFMDGNYVFSVTAVTVSQDGWERTVTWTGMTVCQVPARTPVHVLTSSMASPASVARASEVRTLQDAHCTHALI